jgi:ankyrin repeat protein
MMTLSACLRGTTTDLHRAAIAGEVEVVRDLLASGLDPDPCDPDGYTPLLLAGKHAEPDVFRALLDGGAYMEAANAQGMSTLFVVAATGTVSLARELIARGADVNRPARRGLTPLIAAVTSENPDMVRLLIVAGADVEHCDAAGNNVLKWVRQHGTPEMVELIRFPARALETVVESPGPVDLHRAARTGDVERIRECLAGGVPVDARGVDGATPLLVAARQHRRAGIAVLLAAGADPHRPARTGFTPLLLAATSPVALRPFVAAGVDLNRLSPRLGIGPLHHAARHGFADAVRELLSAGADRHLRDRDGRTPLDHAESHGHSRVVRLLRGE